MRTTTQRPGKGMPLVTHQDSDVPDQTGTLAIVTGANSGIDFRVSQRLATAGGRDDPCRSGSCLFFVFSSVVYMTDLSVPERSASWHYVIPRIKQQR